MIYRSEIQEMFHSSAQVSDPVTVGKGLELEWRSGVLLQPFSLFACDLRTSPCGPQPGLLQASFQHGCLSVY